MQFLCEVKPAHLCYVQMKKISKDKTQLAFNIVYKSFHLWQLVERYTLSLMLSWNISAFFWLCKISLYLSGTICQGAVKEKTYIHVPKSVMYILEGIVELT